MESETLFDTQDAVRQKTESKRQVKMPSGGGCCGGDGPVEGPLPNTDESGVSKGTPLSPKFKWFLAGVALLMLALLGARVYRGDLGLEGLAERTAEDPDWYAVLRVPRSASDSEIRSAFRRLSRELHPDRNPNCGRLCEVHFERVSRAYKVLSDPMQRRAFNAGRRSFDPLPSAASTLIETLPQWEQTVLRSDGVWLVQPFVDWDESARRFAALWEDAAQKLGGVNGAGRGVVQFARVQAAESLEVMAQLPVAVRVYPTVLVYSAGRFQGTLSHTQLRSRRALLAAVVAALPDRVGDVSLTPTHLADFFDLRERSKPRALFVSERVNRRALSGRALAYRFRHAFDSFRAGWARDSAGQGEKRTSRATASKRGFARMLTMMEKAMGQATCLSAKSADAALSLLRQRGREHDYMLLLTGDAEECQVRVLSFDREESDGAAQVGTIMHALTRLPALRFNTNAYRALCQAGDVSRDDCVVALVRTADVDNADDVARHVGAQVRSQLAQDVVVGSAAIGRSAGSWALHALFDADSADAVALFRVSQTTESQSDLRSVAIPVAFDDSKQARLPETATIRLALRRLGLSVKNNKSAENNNDDDEDVDVVEERPAPFVPAFVARERSVWEKILQQDTDVLVGTAVISVLSLIVLYKYVSLQQFALVVFGLSIVGGALPLLLGEPGASSAPRRSRRRRRH